MPYDPPTLAELRTKVARDLRDPNLGTFLAEQLTDFINMGIAELNVIRPKEARVVYQGDTDWPNEVLPFTSIWMVETAIERNVGDTLHFGSIHPANESFGYERSGWEFYAGRLLWPGIYEAGLANLVERYGAAQVYIAIWGYADRDLLVLDADVADFQSALDEMIVRAYAKLEGLRSLSNDRALFQQWQEQSNNSDVSPTQLGGMRDGAEGTFDRMRKRHHLIRRPPTG